MFLARNGFYRLTLLALLLGILLRVLGDDLVVLPFARSTVLVRNLVPGVVTILLGWAAQDQWVGCQVATVRRAWVLTGTRALASVSLCLVASGVALVGQREPALLWLCVSFTGPAVLLAQHLSWWWAVPLVAQVALLEVGLGVMETPMLRIVTDPVVATLILAFCLVLAAATGSRTTGRSTTGGVAWA